MENPYHQYKTRLAEIRQQYPVLHRFGDVWALEIYNQLQEGQINEFLLTTVSVEKTIQTLKKRYPDVHTEVSTFDEIVCLFNVDTIWYIEGVLEMTDGFGWYPSQIDGQQAFTFDRLDKRIVEIAKYKKGTVYIVFEKKYEEEQELEPFYFHITPDIYRQEVERIGLVPKSHSKLTTHPDRIYLLNPTSRTNLLHTGMALLEKAKPEVRDKTQTMIVYKIDTSKVKNLVVYEDPNFLIGDGAVWTQKNIPPSAMKVYMEL